MTATSLPELRPLSVGQLFDRAFRLYRNNFGLFLGIIAITQIPLAIFQIATSSFFVADFPTAFDPVNPDFGAMGSWFLVIMLLVIVSSIASTIGTAALTRAVADNYLGKSVTILGSFAKIGRSWWTLLGTLFLAGLVIGALFIPLFLVALIPCLGGIIFFIGLIALAVSANAGLAIIPAIVILEKKRPLKSIERAWAMAKLRFWWVVGYTFLLGLLSFVIVQGPGEIVSLIFNFGSVSIDPLVATIIQQTLILLLSTIFLPIRHTAITLMYFDLRIRFEGFDLMLLAADDEVDISDLGSTS
jgi:hypothetical protein